MEKGFKGIITVKEWFFDKTNRAAADYGVILEGEYIESETIGSVLDHTKLRVEDVLAESEKAVKVALDATTRNGSHRTWTTWIPKSVIC